MEPGEQEALTLTMDQVPRDTTTARTLLFAWGHEYLSHTHTPPIEKMSTTTPESTPNSPFGELQSGLVIV